MKNLCEYLAESLLCEGENIKNEKDFRDYAKMKFEKAFGDDLDEDKMNKVVDGILDKYKEDAENGNYGKLVGVLNKSFG